MRQPLVMDERAQTKTESKCRRQESHKEDSETALPRLLREWEKEVRDATRILSQA